MVAMICRPRFGCKFLGEGDREVLTPNHYSPIPAREHRPASEGYAQPGKNRGNNHESRIPTGLTGLYSDLRRRTSHRTPGGEEAAPSPPLLSSFSSMRLAAFIAA